MQPFGKPVKINYLPVVLFVWGSPHLKRVAVIIEIPEIAMVNTVAREQIINGCYISGIDSVIAFMNIDPFNTTGITSGGPNNRIIPVVLFTGCQEYGEGYQ
jgi:hypothetical protein